MNTDSADRSAQRSPICTCTSTELRSGWRSSTCGVHGVHEPSNVSQDVDDGYARGTWSGPHTHTDGRTFCGPPDSDCLICWPIDTATIDDERMTDRYRSDVSDDAPAMPEWAASSGWCLKVWIPVKGYIGRQAADTCLLQRGHDGKCRTIRHGYMDYGNAVFVQQLEEKAAAT